MLPSLDGPTIRPALYPGELPCHATTSCKLDVEEAEVQLPMLQLSAPSSPSACLPSSSVSPGHWAYTV